VWAICYFSTTSKCDYITNNIVEVFNNWIKDLKSLPPIELLDAIRLKIFDKFYVRRKLADKLTGKVLPSVMKQLYADSRGLVGYVVHKGTQLTTEISGVHKNLTPWKHNVDLAKKECSCNKWSLTGLPYTHALCAIGGYKNLEIANFVNKFYSMKKIQSCLCWEHTYNDR
jgi:hypothetical protein